MKNIQRLLTISAFLLLLMPDSARSELVSYIDDNGEMHYVNTSFAKVPEKYLSQVEAQLNPPAVENETPAPPPVSEPGTKTGDITKGLPAPDPVEVLTSADCMTCQKLFMLLNAHKIEFLTLDVNTSPRGQELYAETGGELPVTKIGTTTIYGLDVKAIVSTYHAQRSKRKEAEGQIEIQAPVSKETPEPSQQPPAQEAQETIEEIEPETKVYEF